MIHGRISKFVKRVMGSKTKFKAPAPTLQSRPKGPIKPLKKRNKPNYKIPKKPSSGIGVGP